MRFTTLLPVLLAVGVAQAQFGQNNNNNNNGQNNNGQNNNNNNNGQNNNNNGQNNNNNNNNNGGNNGGNAALALDPANVQDASNADGLADGAEEGQAASDTDGANFINFCTGKTLTNGLQIREGSCNGIVMGELPAANRMVSAVFSEPLINDNIGSGEDITFSVKIANLQAGSFTNPDVTYYSAPQALQGGQVVGHTHITVQDLNGQKDPANALDAETFAFFKGINDAGNGQGTLSAALPGGLPDGVYRACSMTSSSNHAPVVMPVAQRGPQDDCIRFSVGEGFKDVLTGGNNNQGGNNNNNNNNQGGNQNNNGQGQQGQGQQGQGQQGQGQQGQGQQGQGQQGQGQQGQGQQGQGQQGQGQQGQGQGGQGQGGQGQGGFGGRGRGRGRFNRPKFAARDFIA